MKIEIPKLPPVKISVSQQKRNIKRKAGFLISDKTGKEVTQTELSEFLGVTPKTVAEWRELGMPSFGAGRALRYDTAAATRWKMNFELKGLREELTEEVDPNKMGIQEAKTRKEVAGALMAELQLAKEREQVANIDYLMEKFADSLVEVRAKLVSLSSRKSGELSHQDQDAVSKIIDKEVSTMLEVLSEYG